MSSLGLHVQLGIDQRMWRVQPSFYSHLISRIQLDSCDDLGVEPIGVSRADLYIIPPSPSRYSNPHPLPCPYTPLKLYLTVSFDALA